MTELIIFVCGIIVGAIVKASRPKIVLESESETIARLRAMLKDDIAKVEREILDGDHGWSGTDDLRTGIRLTERLLDKLPRASAAGANQ